jgi:hypothetical protein
MIKKTITLAFIITTCMFLEVNSQTSWNKGNVSAFMFSEDKIEVMHRGLHRGTKEVSAIFYPDPYENLTIVNVTVYTEKNDWLYIDFGWVKVGTVKIGIQNYDNKEVKLFDNLEDMKQIGSIYDSQDAIILDVNKDWAFLEVIDSKGNKIKGWVDPKWYCDNPYSTCP